MRQSLRLISLSNYVFVLEISQISGIAQNVSMLITVVMRIVAVVGGRRRKGEKECRWNPEPSLAQVLFHQTQGCRSFAWRFTWKMSLLSDCPPPLLPVQGCPYL